MYFIHRWMVLLAVLCLFSGVAGCGQQKPTVNLGPNTQTPSATDPKTPAELVAKLKAMSPGDRRGYAMKNMGVAMQAQHDPATSREIYTLMSQH